MPPEYETGAVVTLREMHEDLRATREVVTRLEVLVETHIEKTTAFQEDHEARLRDLEKTSAKADDLEQLEARQSATDKKLWYATGGIGVLAVLFPNLGQITTLFGG